MRRTKYFFGRLHLAGMRGDKYPFLMGGLATHKTVLERGYMWGFFDVEELRDSAGRFIAGYLAKLDPLDEEEVGDLMAHRLTQEVVANRIVAKSRFVIHFDTSLIAFHRSGAYISPWHFRKFFAAIFREAYDDLFVDADIQIIEERFKFLERLAAFEQIRTVNLFLHPTNPNFDQFYASTDRRLRALEVAKYEERYEFNPDADPESIQNDEDVQGKIMMAEDGYGEARVSGRVDGQEQTISTSQNPVTTLVTSGLEVLDALIDELRPTLLRIRDRIR